jgi:hypothetical protein
MICYVWDVSGSFLFDDVLHCRDAEVMVYRAVSDVPRSVHYLPEYLTKVKVRARATLQLAVYRQSTDSKFSILLMTLSSCKNKRIDF